MPQNIDYTILSRSKNSVELMLDGCLLTLNFAPDANADATELIQDILTQQLVESRRRTMTVRDQAA